MKSRNTYEVLMMDGNIIKHLVLFSTPLIIGNILQQLYQVADMLVAGNFIQDNGISLAAIGSGTSFITMMIGFFIGISTGAGVVISQHFGAEDRSAVRKTIRISLKLAFLTGAALTVIGIIFCNPLLSITNTPSEVFEQASIYLKIYYIGFLPLLIYNMGAAAIQALGNSRTPFFYLLISCGINVILDVFFVVLFHWNVAGIASATVVTQIIACILILLKIKQMLPDEEENLFLGEDFWPTAKKILFYGLPVGFQQMTINLSNLIIQAYINALGTEVVAAWGIFSKLDGFLLLPTFSFGIAITTFTGQNVGAKKLDRVRAGFLWALILSIGTTVLIGLVLLSNTGYILGLFSDNPAIIRFSKDMLWNTIPFYGLLALMKVYSGVLNGFGHSLISMVIVVVNLCGIRILCLYLVNCLVGASINAIYYSYWTSWILCAVTFVIYYEFIFRARMKN